MVKGIYRRTNMLKEEVRGLLIKSPDSPTGHSPGLLVHSPGLLGTIDLGSTNVYTGMLFLL